MSKHIPGPWIVEKERQPDGSRRIMAYNDGFPFPVAHSCATERNAHLIAAAPLLLGQLEEALDQLESWNEESEPTFTMRRASEAIKKAKGDLS